MTQITQIAGFPVFDPYYGAAQYTAPMQHAFAVTPSDGTPLTAVPRGLYIGGSGDVTVILRNDPHNGTSLATGATTQPVTYKNVQAGTAVFVMATGTTATNIVAHL
jgi:hypothetical protein